MKKILLALFLFSLPSNAQAALRVVATLPVFAELAQEIGGDRVTVVSLSRGTQDPHFLDAKPSYVVELNKADLLIQGGLDLEVGWLPPILVQARNGKIQPNTPGNVNLSQGIPVLEVPKVPLDRSMGDVHPLGNPHIWLDPRNMKLMAANIFQHLASVDPEGKSYYENRLKVYLGRLNTKIAQWESEAAPLNGVAVITFHRSFSYLSNWMGFKIVDTIESKPGIPPSSKHVDQLLKVIPQEKVRIILVESFYPQKIPKYLSEKTGVPMLVAPTDLGESGIKTYFDLVGDLIKAMTKALQ